MRFLVISGIRPSFPGLSQSQRQVTHVLLTRSPLIQPVQAPVFIVRLACVKHAASVRPEPGSNSPLENKKAWITWSQNKNETMIQTPHGVRWLITASSCHSDNQKVFKNTYKYLVSVSVNKPPPYLWEKEAIYWTKHTIEFSNNKPHEPITPHNQHGNWRTSVNILFTFFATLIGATRLAYQVSSDHATRTTVKHTTFFQSEQPAKPATNPKKNTL